MLRGRRRAKSDMFTMVLYLVFILILAVGGFTCYKFFTAGSDPANFENHWKENMLTYRSDMERGDRMREQGRWDQALEIYEDAMRTNRQNETSIVLHERVARTHYQEGIEHYENGRYADAIASLRLCRNALGEVGRLASSVREFDNRFRDEVITRPQATAAMVEALIDEGIRRRDDMGNPDGALTVFREARELIPDNLRASKELIVLLNQTQDFPLLLEALRHLVTTISAENLSPEDQAYLGQMAQAHARLQDHLLATYPVEQWAPMVDGLVMNFHETYISLDGTPIDGPPFTRTMRLVSPNEAHVGRNPANPEFIFRWQSIPGLGDFYTEEWTPALARGQDTQFYYTIPRHLRMGYQWPNADGRTWMVADIVYDPEHSLKLIISGHHLRNFEYTLGVGRTSGTPYGEEGDELDSITYPGG
ncbi:tetratricopeptide repeat protein [Candidatus Sumerlaeota bacterium]|nr:tetratricopeptide repeat protein [Candidatus Sumerlaeota bacterium]